MLEDCPLCPVLALVLAKTEDKRKNTELLFISYKDGHKGDLHKNTLRSTMSTKQQRGRRCPLPMPERMKSVP